MVERIGRSADALKKLGDEAAHASASAGKAADAVSADALPELQRLLGEMNLLAASLRHLVEETERNPRGFLFGRKTVPEGPGERVQKGNDK